MNKKHRRHKRHRVRFITCVGCGGRVDLDSDDVIYGLRILKGQTRTLAIHDRTRCAEGVIAWIGEMPPEERAQVRWQRFTKKNPELAVAIVALSQMAGDES
jgi:hypothetical protein